MAIINFKIKKLEATRTGEVARNVDVKSNFAILSMKKENDPRIGDYLLVNFRFDVKYEPNLGSINIDGNLWYHDKELDDTVSEKDGKIELKKDAVLEISNSILQDSLVECVDIARKVRLPLPIQLPKIKVEPKELQFIKAS